jgi:hypothetical protein
MQGERPGQGMSERSLTLPILWGFHRKVDKAGHHPAKWIVRTGRPGSYDQGHRPNGTGQMEQPKMEQPKMEQPKMEQPKMEQHR